MTQDPLTLSLSPLGRGDAVATAAACSLSHPNPLAGSDFKVNKLAKASLWGEGGVRGVLGHRFCGLVSLGFSKCPPNS